MVGDPSTPFLAPDGSEVPEGTSPRRALLGELLVQSKVITAEQLGEVLGSPREKGKKLGQALLERGWITEAQLTQTLSLQLSVPWVSLYHIDFSRQLLNRVARELADQHCLIPIFVRHVKGQGETLYVAMDDPTNAAALTEVARQAGLPTRPMIASASDIRSAIRVYYGEPSTGVPFVDVPPPPTRAERPASEGSSPAGEGSTSATSAPREATAPSPEQPRSQLPPPPPAPRRPQPSASLSPPSSTDEAPPTTRSHPPPSAAPDAAESRPPSRTNEVDTPRRRPRMVNLTLLDGTTISLPAKKAKTAENLTAHDFVGALRARASGADAREILGDDIRWEPVVAALLSILLRKGLIADWEFVEELRKL